jgi:hypothetical protein
LYNNWISFCKYDLRAGTENQPNVNYSGAEAQEFLSTQDNYKIWIEGY